MLCSRHGSAPADYLGILRALKQPYHAPGALRSVAYKTLIADPGVLRSSEVLLRDVGAASLAVQEKDPTWIGRVYFVYCHLSAILKGSQFPQIGWSPTESRHCLELGCGLCTLWRRLFRHGKTGAKGYTTRTVLDCCTTTKAASAFYNDNQSLLRVLSNNH